MFGKLGASTDEIVKAIARRDGLRVQEPANVGKTHITLQRLAHLRRELKPGDKRQLLADLALAPTWMHRYLRYIAEENA